MTTHTAITRGPAAARTAWLILAVLLLFSIAAPLNQFKVPPIMPILMDAFGLSVSGAGLLMSVYAVTGLILALPSGLILQRVGFRVTGLIAGGAMVLGSVLGALSSSSGAFLVTRVIEGVGTSFTAVLAPALIAQWFIASQRGTAMGVWSAWVPVGTALSLIIAPPLAEAFGWQAVWWFGAAYALAVTLLYLSMVHPAPVAPATTTGRPAPEAAAFRNRTVLQNRNIWLLAAAFAAYVAALIGCSTFLPTFLVEQRGLPLAQAARLAVIPTFITIFSAPAGGVLSDKIGSRKKPLLVGIALGGVLVGLWGVATGAAFIALLILSGLVLGLAPTAIFSGAIEVVGDERGGGLTMAVIMVGQSAGMLLGPVIFGTLIQTAGWPAAFASVPVIAAVGFVAGLLARVR